MEVELSYPELRRAMCVGIDRFVRALSADRTPMYGVGHNDWQAHVVGACGECVVAKTTDTYWVGDLGHPDRGAADVGPYHVRTTTDPNGRLILHPHDVDGDPFVLVVVGRLPTFRIVGWCLGSEGKQAEHWVTATGRPAFFVPQSVLRPLGRIY